MIVSLHVMCVCFHEWNIPSEYLSWNTTRKTPGTHARAREINNQSINEQNQFDMKQDTTLETGCSQIQSVCAIGLYKDFAVMYYIKRTV